MHVHYIDAVVGGSADGILGLFVTVAAPRGFPGLPVQLLRIHVADELSRRVHRVRHRSPLSLSHDVHVLTHLSRHT